MKIPVLPFYFLRHGQTDWNIQPQDSLETDVGLNGTGKLQIASLADVIAKISIATMAISPLRRTQETARIISHVLPQARLQLVPDLQEPYGVSHTQSTEETVQDFFRRIARGIRESLLLPGPVLIVAHEGSSRALHHLLGIPHIHVGNGDLLAYTPSLPTAPSLSWKVEKISPSR